MGAGLRILMVEDCEDDAELLLAELRRSDPQLFHQRVYTESDLRRALRENVWDAILSDFSLPQFDAHGVLRTVKDVGIDVPVLVVSGTLDEEAAVSLLRSGAQDFILKDRLARLVPAIHREVREAKVRAEQRQLREQLMISDRMASIGALAAGVAHEINNPLGVLLGTLEFMGNSLRKAGDAHVAILGPRFKGFMGDATEAAERIRQIARDITTFSRSDVSPLSAPVDLSQVIASSLRMAKPHIRLRAKVIQNIEPVPNVLAPEGRLGQLFLNLLVNAAHAIPEGNYEQNEIRIDVRAASENRIEVAITDTGCGIAPEHQQRIFDPFFTTKPQGVGTGLGLPICKRIVVELGGELTVESQLGRGTTFRVVLPASRSERPSAPRVPSTQIPTAPRGRVLIIDDERLVVNLVEGMLSNHHDVVGTTDPEQALELIGAEYFDAIVCDVMMPKLSGTELYKAVRRRTPRSAARFVFMSGASAAEAVREAIDGAQNPILYKPFEAQRLLAVVNTQMLVQDGAIGVQTPMNPWSAERLSRPAE